MSGNKDSTSCIHQSQVTGLMMARLQRKEEVARQLRSKIADLCSELESVQNAVDHYKAVISDLAEDGLVTCVDEVLSDESNSDLSLQEKTSVPESDDLLGSRKLEVGVSEVHALKRSPIDMMQNDFKEIFNRPDHKFRDVIAYAINKTGKPINTTELTEMIYDTRSSEEFSRARNSLSAELRAELKRDDGEKPLWRKLNRNTYAPNDWGTKEFDESATHNMLRFPEASALEEMPEQNGHNSLLAYN